MNLVNLSTAVHRLAKLTANDEASQIELRQHPALRDLLEAIAATLSGLDASEAQPQSLSNVAWSLATIRLVNRPLLQVVTALAVVNIASFKPFELSTMLWALAKLGTLESASWCVKPVFQAAATHISKQVHTFGFRCLATTAWAFATARQRHAKLFRSIAAQMVPMVHAANCQEMANTAWAFGTADFHDDQLFSELAEKALLRLEEFKPQELSNILWGFATNGFFHEAFFANASRVAQHMSLQAQHLANILWAFARVRPRHAITHTTILTLLPSCTMQLDTFKPQEISSTALAVAKAFGYAEDGERGALPPPPSRGGLLMVPPQVSGFFGAAVPWAMPRLHEFSAQSLANTVSAYAMVPTVGGEALFAAIGNEVLTRFTSLEATALLHLLKGFSAVPPEFGAGIVRALSAAVGQRVEELRPQELQTLSRVCASLLGMRRHREFNVDELRAFCVSLGTGEAPIQNSQPSLAAAELLASQDDSDICHTPLSAIDSRELLALPMCTEVEKPRTSQKGQQRKRIVNQELRQPASSNSGAASSSTSSNLAPKSASSPSHRADWAAAALQLSTINESDSLAGCGAEFPSRLAAGGYSDAEYAAHQLEHPMAFPGPYGQKLSTATHGYPHPLPLQLQVLAHAHTLHGVAQHGPGNFGLEATDMMFLAKQKEALRAYHQQPYAAQAACAEGQRRCSVKNTFLHIVDLNEDRARPVGVEADDDGGSSQRSSSVPSRLEHCDDFWEMRKWQQPDQADDDATAQDWNKRYPGFNRLDFDWGPPQAIATTTSRSPWAAINQGADLQ